MTRRLAAEGYILLSVLVAIVVITLLATAVASVSERAVSQAQSETDAFQAELDAMSTRETVLFLMATQRQTVAGLTVDNQINLSWGNARYEPEPGDPMATPPPIPIGNEIALDGTPYKGIGDTRFALQDDGGRFSINWTPNPLRQRFLDLIGVAPGLHSSLDDARLDFQDPDSAHRPGGGEMDDYAALGLPPPTNRPLQTPLQMRELKGWRDVIAPLSDADVVDLFTASGTAALNPNTAGAKALMMLPGMDETKAQRILAQRRQQPFLLQWELLGILGGALDDDSGLISLLPSGAGTLKLWNTAQGPISVLHLTLTPFDDAGQPWRIGFQITLPRNDDIDTLPARIPSTSLISEHDPAGS